jgi:hypothetical protein
VTAVSYSSDEAYSEAFTARLTRSLDHNVSAWLQTPAPKATLDGLGVP